MPMASANLLLKVKVLVAQSCPTPCDPMDWNPPGFSAHGIFQARILEWIVIPFSREFLQLMDQTWVSWIAGRFFTVWATREAKDIFLVFRNNLMFTILGSKLSLPSHLPLLCETLPVYQTKQTSFHAPQIPFIISSLFQDMLFLLP